MTTLVFANNASSTLASSISAASTTIPLASGDGSKFPAFSSQHTYITIEDSSGNFEIVKIDGRSGDNLNVATSGRGKDGTSAMAFNSGAVVEIRPCAIMWDEMLASAPAGYLALSGGTMTGPIDEAEGLAIASASTVDLSTATGNFLHVTGTTTITAVTLAQGAERTVVFDGSLLLTNSASLILPGGANITTQAGDVAVFRGEGASVTRLVSFQRMSAVGAGVEFVAAQAASASATIDFKVSNAANLFNGTFDGYLIKLSNVKPATDDDPFILRVGTGGTPTWQATGYQHASRQQGPSGGSDLGSASDIGIYLTRSGVGQGVGSAANEHLSGEVWIDNPDGADFASVRWHLSWIRSDGVMQSQTGAGMYGSAGAITGIRFLFVSGNIASGDFRVYGLRKTA